ncbi:MAG: hypothetical protein AB1489_12880 [Acidobacteriota bacterium]
MRMEDIAGQMLQAYVGLQPEQQLEVLIRLWSSEEPAAQGMGKAMLLAILVFEALGVPTSSITPESLVETVNTLRGMANRLKTPLNGH